MATVLQVEGRLFYVLRSAELLLSCYKRMENSSRALK